MSDPIFKSGYEGFLCCDRDPTADEPIITALPLPSDYELKWWNQSNSSWWWLTNYNTAGIPLVWQKYVTDANIKNVLENTGWKLNTGRAYSSVSSPVFNSSRTPSATNDVQILASVSLTSTLLTPASVTIQIDGGSGFNTVATLSLAGVAAANTQTSSLIVPRDSSYKLVQASGVSSIVSLYELVL
jgi:hypothetical protein